jgi:hypothetical protein
MKLIRSFFAISLLACIIPSALFGQGGFYRVNAGYNIADLQYSTPWDQYFDFDTKSVYQFGMDIGYSYKPRNSSMAVRYTAGLQYQHLNLSGTVKSDIYNREFILNTAFDDGYDFLTVPLRLEFMFEPRSFRRTTTATWGFALGLNISKVLSATSDVTMADGSHQNYDIDTRDVLLSGSVGGLLDLALNRNMALEFFAGYHYAFQNLLTAKDATLNMNYVELSARLKMNLYRTR